MNELVLLGFLGSLAAGLMTAVGAVPVLLGRAPSERARDTLLGFAAGVMLAASFFSLIVPSIDLSTERYGDGALPPAIAVARGTSATARRWPSASACRTPRRGSPSPSRCSASTTRAPARSASRR